MEPRAWLYPQAQVLFSLIWFDLITIIFFSTGQVMLLDFPRGLGTLVAAKSHGTQE